MKKINLLIICLLVFQLANSQTNLITNGDLENWSSTTLDNWQGQEGSISQELVELTSGTSSALFVDGDTTPKLLALNFPVEAGKTYTLSYDFKVKTGSSNFGQQVIGTKYGGADFSPYTSSNRIPQNFDWNTREVEIEVTETEDWQFEISLGNFIDESFEVYIDNIKFEEIQAEVPEPDRDALIAIYNALDGPNWTNPWNLTEPVDTWEGVTLDFENRVTELIFRNRNLNGALPAEIGNLDKLKVISFIQENITGTIPDTIGQLENLEYISFFITEIEGNIPSSISQLINLETLRISSSNLTGVIPLGLENLSLLTDLDLGSNSLSGTIPHELGNLINLQRLQLDNNNLDGGIPTAINDLVSLTTLDLGGNDFNGDINLSNQLTNLSIVKLDNNNFTSGLENIMSLPKLIVADISRNPFPVYTLDQILEVIVSDQTNEINLANTNLTGILPTDYTRTPNLTSLDVASNDLTGSIPSELTSLPNLNRLLIRNNNFSGMIPTFARSVSVLDISSNEFVFDDMEAIFTAIASTGGIFRYGFQAKVGETETITLQNNSVTLNTLETTNENNTYQWLKNGVTIDGAINNSYVIENPSELDNGIYTCKINNTVIVDLTLTRNDIELTGGVAAQPDRDALIAIYNALDGPNWTNSWDLADSYTTWNGITVNETNKVIGIDLGNNNLTGIIPTEIGNLDALKYLDLGTNNISGTIPESLYNLNTINSLNLQGNNITGTISENLGNLTSLNYLNLGQNDLSGEIPNIFTNFQILQTVELYSNQFVGNIPSSLSALSINCRLILSDNNITGEIPETLSSVDFQDFLVDRNELSGSIPDFFTNMPNLKSLNLGYNNFVGTVPDFSTSEALELIDLSFNNLTGAYPSSFFTIPTMRSINFTGNNFDEFSITETTFDQLVNLRFFSSTNTYSLSGSLPSDFNENPLLSSFQVSGNNLEGEVPAYTNPLLSRFWISNNQFIFEDLEGSLPFYNNSSISYSYRNQDMIDEEVTLSYQTGTPLTLRVTETSSINNTYQWRKGNQDIENATNATYTINNPTSDDEGVYTCVVSNSIVTNISLFRNSITVVNGEEDLDALIALYNATDGENWSTTWDLTQGYDTWFGITTDDQNKVTRINLPNNNLVGTIPSELADLDALRDLVISNNEISGVIPQSLTTLELISTLDVANNKLSGDIPLLNLSRLSFFALNDNEYIFENLEPAIDYYPSGGPLIFNYIGQANIDDEQTLAFSEGESVTLSVTGTSSATNTYEWLKNGNPIDGATGADFTIDSLVVEDSGAYTCEVKNIEVPNLTLTRNTITLDITLGVNDNNFSNSVSIISNAKEKQLSIETSANLQGEVNLTIYNLLGQIVASSSFIEAVNLPTSTWSSGVYVVKLQSENAIATKKVLIK